MPNERKPRILLVDDQLAVALGLARALGDEVEAVIVASGAEALDVLKSGARFDLVLSDVAMPGMSGTELFALTRALDPSIIRRFAFLTGATEEVEEERIAATGARRLTKPASLAGVRALLGLH
jgi:two-component system, NtrC family, sensor kinase